MLLAPLLLPGWMDPAVLILNQQDKMWLVLHHKFQFRGFTDTQEQWIAKTSGGTYRNLTCSMHRPHLRNQNSSDSLQYILPPSGGRSCSFKKQHWENDKATRSCHELLTNYLGSLLQPRVWASPCHESPECQTLSKCKRWEGRFLLQPGHSKTPWQ